MREANSPCYLPPFPFFSDSANSICSQPRASLGSFMKHESERKSLRGETQNVLALKLHFWERV